MSYADIIERLETLEGPLLDGFKVRDLADLIPAVVHDAETSWLFGVALSGRLESLGAAISLVERMLPDVEYTARRHVSEGFSASLNFVNDQGHWVFGASKNNCPNLAVAMILAAFSVLENSEAKP